MLHVDILTEEKEVYKGDALFVILPGGEGELGIMPGHASLLSTLAEGTLTIRQAGREKHFRIGAGFVEIRNDTIQVIVSHVEVMN